MGSFSESSESRSPLSNSDFTIPRGDGNENVKNNNRCTVGKTTTLHVHRTFLCISMPFLHNYDMKLPNFTFYGERKKATMKFYSLFKLEYVS